MIKKSVRKIKPTKKSKSCGENIPIVAIGASAGGLEAIEGFFAHTPSNILVAFVIIQHLSPDHKSIMGSLLAKYTKIKVLEIRDGMKVCPGCIYLNPPNRDVSIMKGKFFLAEPTQPRAVRLSIDNFFRSLAQEQGDKSICIILSGTGSDGTLGLKAIKDAGGLAMVQDEKQARYDNMPRSAIDTGLVDFVLPVEKMPAEIMKYLKHPYIIGEKKPSALDKNVDSCLQKIFILIRTETGHDFSQYKVNTIRRRVERRMAVHQINEMSKYVTYLQKNPPEIKILFRDFLITVTNFFRDDKAFKALYEKVILPLAEHKPNESSFRIWVAGCATGEEAYSVAIMLAEAMKTVKKHFNVQIFATDIDANAIEFARAGVYPDSIAAFVSNERLKNFFLKDENTYRIKKEIREMVVFATQNIIKDAPFSKLDLVCCRNVLIYINSSLQKKILPLFYYTLNPHGFLFLGTSESVGEFGQFFTPVDSKWKIFKRQRSEIHGKHNPSIPILSSSPEKPTAVKQPELDVANIRQMAEHSILQEYGPSCVLIDNNLNVLYFHGDTAKYLTMPKGEPSFNILKIAREDLRYKLNSLIGKCQKENKAVRSKNTKLMSEGNILTINLQVKPISDQISKSGFMMVTFESIPAPSERSSKNKKMQSQVSIEPRIAVLEQELQSTKEYLHTTIEELETSNEELKSTNEELQSTNEELQSTNEELETSREELQSTNEELETVNTELQNKVDQLSDVNNDLNNLLGCTEIATVFLDNDIRIKRFTPKAADIFKLINSDIGRPISDIAHNLLYEDLVKDAENTLKNLGKLDKEIQAKNGFWYLMRILPYRTMDNAIDGVVVTFVDISKQKKAEEILKEKEGR
jgi:two-component system CheB/CheR fusion protein